MAQQPVTTAKPKPLTRQLSAVSTAHVSMRQHAMHFMEADLNEDGVLSRAEFHSSLPASVRNKHTEKEVDAWFDLLDGDGDGVISRAEHFAWSLNAAAISSGAGVAAVFARFDKGMHAARL